MNNMHEERFLARLEDELGAAVADHEDALLGASRPLVLAPRAKRARPRLCFRVGQLVGADPQDVLAIATAAELLHNASLLHDDVVDAGHERRGQPTANHVHGNGVAVLAGDLLITLALHRLRGLPPEITTDGVETVALMARAALLELQARGHAALDLETWRRIARGKTGALLGFCARAGALSVGDAARAALLGNFAERLGVAFQMADDLADFERGTGKVACKDLKERTPGLPVVLAGRSDRAVGDEIQRVFTAHPDGVPDHEASRLALCIAETGAFTEARALLAREVEGAVRILREDVAGPGRDELLGFAAGLLDPRYFVTEGRAA